MARRCSCPTESLTPLSPIRVSYFWGSSCITSWIFAAWHTSFSSSCEASGFTRRRFSATDRLKKTGFCITADIALLLSFSDISQISSCPIRTVPDWGFNNPRRIFANVVLPHPLFPTIAICFFSGTRKLMSHRILSSIENPFSIEYPSSILLKAYPTLTTTSIIIAGIDIEQKWIKSYPS